MADENLSFSAGSRPVPDPTVLTTEALQREIKALKELMSERVQASENLTAQRFLAVEKQLDLVEQQRIEQKSDTRAAVDAALTAQKEAVKEQTTASGLAIDKAEKSTKEQLTQMSTTFDIAIRGVADGLSDLKDRVARIENVKVGGIEARAALYAAAGFVVALITIGGFVLAFAG